MTKLGVLRQRNELGMESELSVDLQVAISYHLTRRLSKALWRLPYMYCCDE